MRKAKFLLSAALVGILLLTQVSIAFAAASPKTDVIAGTVQKISLESDPNTGLTTVLATVSNGKSASQCIRLSIETAKTLGLVTVDGDGKPTINTSLLGQPIEINPTTIISSETQNPVASALTTFFSDIDGLDYNVIMEAHGNGIAFGVIAQTLWITRKLDGFITVESDTTLFEEVLNARLNNDFSYFIFEDGTSPKNWGEFRKAAAGDDKKGTLGAVMSNNKEQPQGNSNGNTSNNKNKDKENNGKGSENGNGKKP
jgi:hypothetical protein